MWYIEIRLSATQHVEVSYTGKVIFPRVCGGMELLHHVMRDSHRASDPEPACGQRDFIRTSTLIGLKCVSWRMSGKDVL